MATDTGVPGGEAVNPATDNPFVVREREKQEEAKASVVYPPAGSNMTPDQKQQAAVERVANPQQAQQQEQPQEQEKTPQQRVFERAKEQQAERHTRMRARGQTPHIDKIPEQYRKSNFTFEGPQNSDQIQDEQDEPKDAGPERVQAKPVMTPPAGDTAHTQSTEFSERSAEFAESTVDAFAALSERLTNALRRIEELEADIEMKDHE